MMIFKNIKEELSSIVSEIKMDIFAFNNKKEINLLVDRLGIGYSEACDFLYHNYNDKVTFKEYFKGKYYSQWVPCGDTEYGRTRVIYTYKFPKRSMNFMGTSVTNEFDWNRVLKKAI